MLQSGVRFLEEETAKNKSFHKSGKHIPKLLLILNIKLLIKKPDQLWIHKLR